MDNPNAVKPIGFPVAPAINNGQPGDDSGPTAHTPNSGHAQNDPARTYTPGPMDK